MAREGPPPDTAALFADLYPRLRRFAAIVGPAEVEPDDLLHEVLVNVLRAGGLGDVEHAEAYLRRSIVNCAANHRRRLGRHRRALVRLQNGWQEGGAPHYPADVIALLSVRPIERAIVYLHAVEGRPYAEIAEQLGMTEIGVRVLGSRARKQLRDLIVADQEEEAR